MKPLLMMAMILVDFPSSSCYRNSQTSILDRQNVFFKQKLRFRFRISASASDYFGFLCWVLYQTCVGFIKGSFHLFSCRKFMVYTCFLGSLPVVLISSSLLLSCIRAICFPDQVVSQRLLMCFWTWTSRLLSLHSPFSSLFMFLWVVSCSLPSFPCHINYFLLFLLHSNAFLS